MTVISSYLISSYHHNRKACVDVNLTSPASFLRLRTNLYRKLRGRLGTYGCLGRIGLRSCSPRPRTVRYTSRCLGVKSTSFTSWTQVFRSSHRRDSSRDLPCVVNRRPLYRASARCLIMHLSSRLGLSS
jgi:hypothetical protein